MQSLHFQSDRIPQIPEKKEKSSESSQTGSPTTEVMAFKEIEQEEARIDHGRTVRILLAGILLSPR